MRTVEICVDRARLEPPSGDDELLDDSYVDVLQRLDRVARIRDLTSVEVSRDTHLILQDRKAFKVMASEWKTRAGAVTPVDVVWVLVKSILDRSVTIEDARGVEIAVLSGPVGGIPDELQYLTSPQVEDLAQLIAMVSRHTQSDGSVDASDPYIVTCLPAGTALHASVQVCIDLILEDLSEVHESKCFDCTLVGDPGDVMGSLNPTRVWLGARDDEERSQAVDMMVMKLAPGVEGPRLRKWRFGSKFIDMARKYEYLAQETRAAGLLEQMAYTILGEPIMGTPRPLYEDEKRSKVRTRGQDEGIHRDIGRDLRLNYWACGDGSVEFGAACGQHDDQMLPR